MLCAQGAHCGGYYYLEGGALGNKKPHRKGGVGCWGEPNGDDGNLLNFL